MMEEKRYVDMPPGDEAPPGESSAGEDVCEDCGGTGHLSGGRCKSCGGTGRVVRAIGGG